MWEERGRERGKEDKGKMRKEGEGRGSSGEEKGEERRDQLERKGRASKMD